MADPNYPHLSRTPRSAQRHVTLKVPVAVHNQIAKEAHRRSTFRGRFVGVATVIRETLNRSFPVPFDEAQAALQGGAKSQGVLPIIQPVKPRQRSPKMPVTPISNARRLFVDLDGVLADFRQHVLDTIGVMPDENGDAGFWAALHAHHEFWLNMPLMPHAHDLWEKVRGYSPVILTGVPSTGKEEVERQKREWVRQHFGSAVEVIATYARLKQNHMDRRGDVLLDDKVQNVMRWNKAGGIGVLYRPDNHTKTTSFIVTLMETPSPAVGVHAHA